MALVAKCDDVQQLDPRVAVIEHVFPPSCNVFQHLCACVDSSNRVPYARKLFSLEPVEFVVKLVASVLEIFEDDIFTADGLDEAIEAAKSWAHEKLTVVASVNTESAAAVD